VLLEPSDQVAEKHFVFKNTLYISEIFDAEAPFVPRGCIAQAWSVVELLRCWVKTAQ
jgi:glycogen debranching enzyme